MKFLLKTVMSSFILATSVNAGTMGNICIPGNVTVPCAQTAWNLGAQALYLKPVYTANRLFSYGSGQIINGVQVYRELENDWKWGFKLEGSYHFNTGNDLNINWSHWRSKTNELINRPSSDQQSQLILNQNDRVEWDAVNVELGQIVRFSEKKEIRFHGGMQFAHLEKNLYAPYTLIPLAAGLLPSNGFNRVQFQYNGVGARTGLDASYNFNHAFSVYNTLATAILVGNNSIDDSSTVLPAASHYRGITPEVEAKLGARFSYPTTKGNFIIDGGYMWINYFNTFYTTQANVQSQTNFALNGPYLGAQWIG